MYREKGDFATRRVRRAHRSGWCARRTLPKKKGVLLGRGPKMNGEKSVQLIGEALPVALAE
jgi:hypothetical protein